MYNGNLLFERNWRSPFASDIFATFVGISKEIRSIVSKRKALFPMDKVPQPIEYYSFYENDISIEPYWPAMKLHTIKRLL